MNVGSQEPQTVRERFYEVIFEADTPAGKAFDVALLVAILVSTLVIMLESVESYAARFPNLLLRLELFFTGVFGLEYVVRIWCARRPIRYIFSFYGLVDLLAILPTIVALTLPVGQGAQRLNVIRALRLLRAFRIFKLAHMLTEAAALRHALWASRSKIAVFLSFILIVVVIVGSAMHLIEGGLSPKQVAIDGAETANDRVDIQPENSEGPSGFDSIPEGMYWAIVTMTTVGYGDIKPVTPLGRTLAAIIMILGYSLIIVPTGIVSAEMAQGGAAISHRRVTTQVCPECMAEGHDADAVFCKYCSAKI